MVVVVGVGGSFLSSNKFLNKLTGRHRGAMNVYLFCKGDPAARRPRWKHLNDRLCVCVIGPWPFAKEGVNTL